MSTVVDTRELERRLRSLRLNEIPTAMRNTLNDLAKDVARREQREIRRVFDRPTPLVAKSPRVTKRASKTDQVAEVSLTASNPRARAVLPRILAPAIPGYPSDRDQKAFEVALQRAGLLGRNQFLLPSNTIRRDQYGNVGRGLLRSMLTDVTSDAGRGRYIWATVHGRSGDVTGIWLASRWRAGKPGALMMLVVDAPPTYNKRFRFHDVARDWARQRLPRHARLACLELRLLLLFNVGA